MFCTNDGVQKCFGIFRTKHVQVVTWNVKKKSPPDDLVKLLDLNEGADVLAVGLQSIASSPFQAIMNTIFSDKWTRALDKIVKKFGYCKVGNVRMIGIVLNVYVKYYFFPKVTLVEESRVRTGFFGLYGNRGGVAVRMEFCGATVNFVVVDLPSKEGSVDQRIRQLEKINKKRIRGSDDYTFLFGSLNFKLDNETLTAEKIHGMLKEGRLDELLEEDQLTKVRLEHDIFKKFSEMSIKFKPTFKYKSGSDTYDLKKRPAWTDRILKLENELQVIQVNYDTFEEMNTGDHKPVKALYLLV